MASFGWYFGSGNKQKSPNKLCSSAAKKDWLSRNPNGTPKTLPQPSISNGPSPMPLAASNLLPLPTHDEKIAPNDDIQWGIVKCQKTVTVYPCCTENRNINQ